MIDLKPMAAVAVLYADDSHDLTEAIIASLSESVFTGEVVKPANSGKILIGHVAQRIVRWTTKSTLLAGESRPTSFRNLLFERSGHPYAQALLTSSQSETVALVEGGDPMNGPYMMLSPEIRINAGLWDRIFFESVQSRDVQLRFVLETRATYDAAKEMLKRGESVRLKAVAAGTGLSLILAYDRLVREGFDPNRITAVVTDRDSANTAKSNRLLTKLASTRENLFSSEKECGIIAKAEDLFGDNDPSMAALDPPYDIVTAIGILEYFQGCSQGSTEKRLKIPEPKESPTAHDFASRLSEMTTLGGRLIMNTYRDHSSIRILEIFGKRFDFRDRRHLSELLAPVSFRSLHLAGSGHIYDVEVFKKVS